MLVWVILLSCPYFGLQKYGFVKIAFCLYTTIKFLKLTINLIFIWLRQQNFGWFQDVPLTIDEFSTANARERRKDLMIDSAISRSNNVEVERELERWTPDVEDLECPELDNIFDGTWNRSVTYLWGSFVLFSCCSCYGWQC